MIREEPGCLSTKHAEQEICPSAQIQWETERVGRKDSNLCKPKSVGIIEVTSDDLTIHLSRKSHFNRAPVMTISCHGLFAC